jgi:hypothetical protein
MCPHVVWVVAGGIGQDGVNAVVPVLLGLLERMAKQCQLTVLALYQEPKYHEYDLLGARVICLGRGRRGFEFVGQRWRHCGACPALL